MASYFDNRDLSWLKFNCRVLEEAEDDSVPLYERLGFVSIFSTNLDEFFSVRVGSLCSRLDTKKGKSGPAAEQLSEISARLEGMLKRRDQTYRTVIDRFADYGVQHISFESCGDADKEYLRNRFATEILPYLSPMITEKKKQLFADNKNIYLAAKLKNSDGDTRYALVSTQSEFFSRVVFVSTDGRSRFVLAEDLIVHFAQLIFTDYTICERALIRFTRSADIDLESAYESDDLEKATERLLEKRRRLPPVRVEYSHASSRDFVVSLAKSSGLYCGGRFIYRTDTPMSYSFMEAIGEKLANNSQLFYDRLSPRCSPMIDRDESMIKQVEQGDKLLMYPYESIEPFISLLNEAADSADVIAIKITLYRVSKNSRVVDALIRAAENGKDVTAVIELRARFDEENNLMWSERLRQAGVIVIHGPCGCKVHSKLMLIVKQSGNGISYITQVGTGNYNEKTAKRYTDMTVITADSGIGGDAFAVFNALSLGMLPSETRNLMTAPSCMKQRMIAMIDEQAALGAAGYIGMKMNSLTDKDVMAHLVEASRRGAKIELIVRGASCLIAGVAGSTDNISLVSVVGNFLEHSRIYIFGRENANIFISSADMMSRNLEKRVEVALPVKDAAVKSRITEYFSTTFGDGVKARVQFPDGIYRRRQRTIDAVNSQAYFYRKAYEAEKPFHESKIVVERVKRTDVLPISQEQTASTTGENTEKLGFFARIKRFFTGK